MGEQGATGAATRVGTSIGKQEAEVEAAIGVRGDDVGASIGEYDAVLGAAVGVLGVDVGTSLANKEMKSAHSS